MNKNRGVAIVLALFFGGFGIHRFYVGQIMWGFIFLLFCWTLIPTLFALFDVIRWSLIGETAFNNRYSV